MNAANLSCKERERLYDTTDPNRLKEWAAPDTAATPEMLSGQLLRREGLTLRRLARSVDPNHCIVEVGSYTGKSACCLAVGSAEGNRAPVYAIDLWSSGTSRKGRDFRRYEPAADGVQSSSKFHHPLVKEKFDRRRAQYDTARLIRPIVGESRDVASRWTHTIGLFFLDAEHTYEAARADLAAWLPRLAGVLAVHDYKSGNDGVQRAVDELEGWALEKVVGSLAILRRTTA